MKKPAFYTYLVISIMLISTFASAQMVEFSAGISGNLYNYGGTLSTSATSYSSSVYSKKLNAGYGAQADLKLVDKDGFILGFNGGYDVLNSKADQSFIFIDYLNDLLSIRSPSSYNYTGYEVTTFKELYANPYLGYRIKGKKYSTDVLLGGEAGFLVETRQKQVTTYNTTTNTDYFYPDNKSAGNENIDYRIKAGVALHYRRIGINLNYAHGISNLRRATDSFGYSQQGSAFSQVIKLGVNYRIF